MDFDPYRTAVENNDTDRISSWKRNANSLVTGFSVYIPADPYLSFTEGYSGQYGPTQSAYDESLRSVTTIYVDALLSAFESAGFDVDAIVETYVTPDGYLRGGPAGSPGGIITFVSDLIVQQLPAAVVTDSLVRFIVEGAKNLYRWFDLIGVPAHARNYPIQPPVAVIALCEHHAKAVHPKLRPQLERFSEVVPPNGGIDSRRATPCGLPMARRAISTTYGPGLFIPRRWRLAGTSCENRSSYFAFRSCARS